MPIQAANLIGYFRKMDQKPKILFICQHNSGRSQIAEAFLKKFAGDQPLIESAGFEIVSNAISIIVGAPQCRKQRNNSHF